MAIHQHRRGLHLAGAAALALALATAALAQVPPEIAKQNREIGPVVEVPKTAAVFGPLQQDEPYAKVTVVRAQQYGATPRAVLDVFKPAPAKGAKAVKPPILIFLPGGGGNIHGNGPNGKKFYDNISPEIVAKCGLARGYPAVGLYLSLVVHQSARCLSDGAITAHGWSQFPPSWLGA
jgi:hypothetical protein